MKNVINVGAAVGPTMELSCASVVLLLSISFCRTHTHSDALALADANKAGNDLDGLAVHCLLPLAAQSICLGSHLLCSRLAIRRRTSLV